MKSFMYLVRRRKHHPEIKPVQAGTFGSDNFSLPHPLTADGTGDTIKQIKVSVMDREGNMVQKDFKKPSRTNRVAFDSTYLNLGYYLITPMLLGVIAGILLDNYFKTKPVLTLLGIMLGTVSTFYNLLKVTKDG